MQPRIGDHVLYRDHNGLDCPAIVTATIDSLTQRAERNPDAPELRPRKIRDLSSPEHVHLTVFGAYTEWAAGTANMKDVAPAGEEAERHTWREVLPLTPTSEPAAHAPEPVVAAAPKRAPKSRSRAGA